MLILMEDQFQVINHPLIQHKLTLMRDKNTGSQEFRRLLREISMLMAYEVTRDTQLTEIEIETPLEKMTAPVIDGKKMALVSILRAGNGILEGMLEILPSARVGHIGLYRDPKTLEAIEYYCKLPTDIEHRDVIVVDPMLATAHTAVAAMKKLKERNPKSIKFVCLVASPEGVKEFTSHFNDIPVYAASLDRQLNEKGYILPGLGDAGDRIYGTK